MLNISFIALSIVSLVLSSKFSRSLTEGKAKTLRTLRGFLLAGIIFSGITISALFIIPDTPPLYDSGSVSVGVVSVFTAYEALFAFAALPLSIVAFVKTNGALAGGTSAPTATVQQCYCANCHAQRTAGSNFCTKCGSQNYYYK